MATSDDAVKNGMSGGIRIAIAIVVAIILTIFITVWDGGFLPLYSMPTWLGSVLFLPLLATVIAFGADSLVQQLSCGNVAWLVQLQRVAIVPVPYWCMSLLLRFLPVVRWPIEGLVQNATPSTRHGLSSGFYTFWVSLYVQSILISLSQLC